MPTVADIEPPISKISSKNQAKKFKLIGGIKQEVATFKFSPPDLRPVDINNLSRTLYSLYGYLGAALEAVGNSDTDLTGQLISLREAIENLRKTMLARRRFRRCAEHAEKLGAISAGAVYRLQRHFSNFCKTRMTARRCALRICRRRCATDMWVRTENS